LMRWVKFFSAERDGTEREQDDTAD
jgi:hypothetical protein